MSLVRTEINDRVAVITLSDPEHRNALSLEMADELSETVERLELQDVGAMVITGEGSAFCAGADLGLLQRAEGTDLVRIYRSFGRVHSSNIPSIAAVNGAAVGAGFNLALVCDLRVAAESALFDTGFLRLAVHPGGGSTWLMRQLLGVEGTVALTLFEETLDGRGAERVGLAWRCVPDADLVATAVQMAGRAARHPAELARKLRHTIGRMETVAEYGSAVQIEMDEQLWSLNQPDARAAIAARMEQIGYVSTMPPPPPPPPPGEALEEGASWPPPPKPREGGFKLFKDD